MIFGLNAFTFAQGCGLWASYFFSLCGHVSSYCCSFQTALPTFASPIPSLIYQLDTRNVMWVHSSSVLQDRSCPFISSIWRDEKRWTSPAQKDETSRCPFIFWGCLLVLEEDGSWLGDKTTKHLLNNLLQVTKAATIREKRSFLEAKRRSPGNTDFSLCTSSLDLLSRIGQSSERPCFISPQIGNLPSRNFYLK